MKLILSLLLLITFSIANDATIEIIKKVDTLPSLAIEDASKSYDNTFQLQFFKTLVADMNVLSIFNVDRHHWLNEYEASNVLVENKDQRYVLRYEMSEDDEHALNIYVKLLKDGEDVFRKSYKVKSANIFMFISHTIAYDINKFMGEPSVEWMKRKVIFSRVVKPRKTELVISDYTLAYQHTIITGGFNLFPKWANKEQNAFYFSSFDGIKPTLKYVNIKTSKIKSILSADGMIICSDVSDNGKKLLVTMAPKGQPDIYLYDADLKKYSRQTRYGGIDVGAHFKGSDSIVFVSNRLGFPNIFSKKINSKEVEQMIYYGRSNSACSTSGQYIVYKARESSNVFSENTFNLHLISTDTDFIRRLTATGINEFPEFSKDGDAILFIKNYKEQSSIGIIRLNHNKNYLFPLKYGRLQSMDW